jgi:hypothetical protein
VSRKKSFRRDARFYRRSPPRTAPSGKAFLIVTEGEKTEPNYFAALRSRLNLRAADVEIVHPPGTDPVTLTKKAIELRDERKEQSEKSFVVEYDEVWVLFDLEKFHDGRRAHAKTAMKLKEAKGIRFAFSDPCFEYWLLLHEEFTTALMPDASHAIKRLKKHWHNYTKGCSPSEEFLEKIPVAVTRAARCRKHHQTSGGDGNPSTHVDMLVRQLNLAAHTFSQFKI